MNNTYEVVRPDEPKQSNRGIILLLLSVIISFVGVYFFYGDSDNVREAISDSAGLIQDTKQDIPLKPEINLVLEHQKTIQSLKNEHLRETNKLSEDIESRHEYIYSLEEKLSSLQSEIKQLQSNLDIALLNLDKALLKIEKTEFQLTQERAKIVVADEVSASDIKEVKSINRVTASQTNKKPNDKVPTQASSGNFTTHKLISSPPPSFPKRAQNRGKEGSALVDYTIMISGNVTNVRLLNETPKGFGFGQAALRAAKGLKYIPSSRNGEPIVSTRVSREYKFSFAD